MVKILLIILIGYIPAAFSQSTPFDVFGADRDRKDKTQIIKRVNSNVSNTKLSPSVNANSRVQSKNIDFQNRSVAKNKNDSNKSVINSIQDFALNCLSNSEPSEMCLAYPSYVNLGLELLMLEEIKQAKNESVIESTDTKGLSQSDAYQAQVEVLQNILEQNENSKNAISSSLVSLREDQLRAIANSADEVDVQIASEQTLKELSESLAEGSRQVATTIEKLSENISFGGLELPKGEQYCNRLKANNIYTGLVEWSKNGNRCTASAPIQMTGVLGERTRITAGQALDNEAYGYMDIECREVGKNFQWVTTGNYDCDTEDKNFAQKQIVYNGKTFSKITIPLRVLNTSFPYAPEYNNKMDIEKFEVILAEVNKIWAQAGIEFATQSTYDFAVNLEKYNSDFLMNTSYLSSVVSDYATNDYYSLVAPSNRHITVVLADASKSYKKGAEGQVGSSFVSFSSTDNVGEEVSPKVLAYAFGQVLNARGRDLLSDDNLMALKEGTNLTDDQIASARSEATKYSGLIASKDRNDKELVEKNIAELLEIEKEMLSSTGEERALRRLRDGVKIGDKKLCKDYPIAKRQVGDVENLRASMGEAFTNEWIKKIDDENQFIGQQNSILESLCDESKKVDERVVASQIEEDPALTQEEQKELFITALKQRLSAGDRSICTLGFMDENGEYVIGAKLVPEVGVYCNNLCSQNSSYPFCSEL